MNREQNIKDRNSFFQAGRYLLEKVHETESVDRDDVLLSWKEVESRLESEHSHKLRIRYVFSAVAASVAILLAVGIGFWKYGNDKPGVSLSLLEQEIPDLPDNEVVLFAQNDKMQLKDEASVKYREDGQPELDEQVVKKISGREKEDARKAINQIVVPKGRKADIIFSDGTKMYVNAGSRVIYPAVFEKGKREIIVEGEVYLDVKKDPARPFIVKTKDFEVKVLGTQFNICAYKEDLVSSVVLVEGKVEVETTNKEKAVLSPNQLISIDDEGTEVKEVDVFEYICWKNNMMLLNNRTAGDVFERLS
ncbi:FecR family protein, partial [uncultured Parabacteroides sp.]